MPRSKKIITEDEEKRRGEILIQVLHLKKDRNAPGRYLTTWGNKTPLGLFRTIERIIEDGE